MIKCFYYLIENKQLEYAFSKKWCKYIAMFQLLRNFNP